MRFSNGETVREAAARLGLTLSTIGMRLRYGWTEEEALSTPRGVVIHPRSKGTRGGARPGVKLTPLTPLEVSTLQMLSEGIPAKELRRNGTTRRAVYSRLDRMRLKLGVFTTAEMVAEGFRKGLIK
jgi:DNA-binding CsgD family transcriptional regulator